MLFIGLIAVFTFLGWIVGWHDIPESDSPQSAVLRIQVSDNSGYTIDWPSAGPEHYGPYEGAYRDHAVPAESFGKYGLNPMTVTADGRAPVNNEKSVEALLFLNGEYTTCNSETGQAYIAVDSLTDPGSWGNWGCGTYRIF